MKKAICFLIRGLVVLGLTATFTGVCAAADQNDDMGNAAQSGEFHLSAMDFSWRSSSHMVKYVKDIIRLRGLESGAAEDADEDDYISFSYEGSTGAIGFSSGYIYAVEGMDVFGFNDSTMPAERHVKRQAADGGKNIYMGLDLSHSINLTDDVVLGMKAGFIYLNDIYSEQKNRAVSLLFVMPLAINDSLTIAPNFHWARYLADESMVSDQELARENDDIEDKMGSFYGGLSISLAY